MIAPYVQADPTAFCSYEDHLLAVDTLLEVCRLRSESTRGQLEGDYPITLAQQGSQPGRGWTPPMWICGLWGISTTWRPQRSGRMRPRQWRGRNQRAAHIVYSPPIFELWTAQKGLV